MNVEWLARLPAPARAAIYFGLQRGIGSRIFARWRDFQTWTRLSPAQVEERVDTQLDHLLAKATTQSTYYRDLKLVRRADETARQFLQRFPILTRETVRERFTDLVIDRLRPEITSPASVSKKRYDWLVVKTGGTTGVPTAVVHDAYFRDGGRATRLFSQTMCGFPLGTRYFRLWGSEKDLLQQKESTEKRVLQSLLGEIPMNAFRAKTAELSAHLATMRRHPEVKHLMAYVDASVSLASFAEENSLPRPRLETIMACAGTVLPEWRKILQQTFSAQVFDKYGSRECADLACECSAHDGLHVYSPHAFLEIVDETGRACPSGVTGRFLVTLLNNFSFPMIRYEIGDVGIWAEPRPCACGLPFPRLQSLQGRQDEMLITSDGTRLSSGFIRHFVGVSMNRQLIREWQFEQTGKDAFVFRYLPMGRAGLDENLRQIRQSFQLALGQMAAIQLQEVAEIPLSPSGKAKWILNNWKRG
ncbi:MAG: phenylacetate--CoA ligase family protein [Verrucomicrobia bacterium]|nr:phenylacetate--CoA ligase family protein [Verrucomicrobiota bacterium]